MSYMRKGKFGHIKSITVDIPCSRNMFVEKFVCNLKFVEYSGEDNFKCTVAPSDLRAVFGDNWDWFIYSKSTTRRRVLGLVKLHFQKKSVTFCTQDTDNIPR